MSEWHADPLGRHQERLHDGMRWTNQVRDRGVVNADAVGLDELQPALPAGPIVPAITSPSRPATTPPPLRGPASEPAAFGKIGSTSAAAAALPASDEPRVPVVRSSSPSPASEPRPLAVAAAGQGPNLSALGKNSILTGLLAGALGGCAGIGLAEVIRHPDQQSTSSQDEARIQSGIFVAIVGAVLGFVLAAWPAATAGAWKTAARRGGVGALAGAVAGFAGGYVAQMLFTSMLSDAFSGSRSEMENKFRLARSLAWALFGAATGLGLGLRDGARRAINGLVGGAIGGAVGGLIFEQIELSARGGSGATTRLAGMTATGIGIGLGIGIVDRLRREAWIKISTGPLRGREIILFKEITTVGADSRCDIVLANDPAVSQQHFSLNRRGGAATSLTASGAVTINGVVPAEAQVLHPGDEIEIGSSAMRFEERTAR